MNVVFLAFISAHMIARWSTVMLGWMMPYVREGASNKPVADGMRGKEFLIATFFAPLWLFADCRLLALGMALGLLVACGAAAGFGGQMGGVPVGRGNRLNSSTLATSYA